MSLELILLLFWKYAFNFFAFNLIYLQTIDDEMAPSIVIIGQVTVGSDLFKLVSDLAGNKIKRMNIALRSHPC